MFRTILAAASAALFATTALAEIAVNDPYARSSNAMAGAAFMTITNAGGTDDRLIDARADISKRVELHTHIEEDGVMRMVHVEEGFELPADGAIEMKRGSYHVMFMGLNEPLEQGDTFPLTLVFESGTEMTIDVTVDNERMDGMMGHGNMGNMNQGTGATGSGNGDSTMSGN